VIPGEPKHATTPTPDGQRQINATVWRSPGHVKGYARYPLRQVEKAIVERYREDLSGSVLEVGVGAGRLTARLVPLARSLHGIDISPAMVEHCRARFAGARFTVADLADPLDAGDGSLDAIFAGFNVLDVLDATDRGHVLADWHRALRPGGLLVVSSHNLASAGLIASPWRVLSRHPKTIVGNLLRLPVRVRNHRRLSRFERFEADWAILVDQAHNHSLLHYYATRDRAERELVATGFSLLESLDLQGRPVAPGEAAATVPELHYVARRAA
jgi:SAM-dependent methyltransferase